MKLLYIISMGHSGSTLLDCIFGSHPQFLSTGEMRFLGWQLWRTKNKKATVEGQNICTCGKDFRECSFWSEVFKQIHNKTGIDITKEPKNFKLNFFNQFRYQDRGPLLDHVKAYIVRILLERGFSLSFVSHLDHEINKILSNNWFLYETMANVSKRPFIVDSSKHLIQGLLIQQSRPEDVWFLFIHRSVYGLVSSSKRWKHKTTLRNVVNSKKNFEKRVALYKKIPNLKYIDVDYEEFVSKPALFLENVAVQLGADNNYPKQSNNNFYIDPSKLHLVAGNPMRYGGKQLVKYDNRWETDLSNEEKELIKKLIRN